ncbi:juvenile hormone esterase-like [Bicyclus anynana]|uniref:Juvenile hormone esterase-like n=1 Tax=Bicyclus anynana TaxID=110368 RepID=A0A6J1P709_BICAN|nr:juvenile hormone esterase-like [Bicyclus anynana]
MNSYKLTYIFLAILINYSVCDDNSEPLESKSGDFETVEVKTKYGAVSGKVERTFIKQHNYFSFKGIPYAETPVGKLRFKPPVPHQGWKETLEAYSNKPTCVQFNTRARVMEKMGISGSEDCLYISVFTPNLEGSAPVIVFDYNDNFRTGFNGTDTYSPDFFIEEDVVVVTISHRLSVFGYLTTMDDVIAPNNGLKDFILGLNWVKDNIKNFGGDTERVTLMGNRGGAVLADILLYSEKAKGLFSRVIMQSGTALEATFFGRNLREKAFKYGEIFNITTDDSEILLEKLQTVDPYLLIDADGSLHDEEQVVESQLSIFPFAPVIEENSEDAVLTSLPEKSNLVNDVPILIGMNSREGLDLAAHFIYDPRTIAESKKFLFLFPIRKNFSFVENSASYDEAIKDILTFYFKEGYFYYNNLFEYTVYIADVLQNYPLHIAAEMLAEKSQSPVYYYLFNFRGSLNENLEMMSRYLHYWLEPWGATIVDELCYLQLCTRIKEKYELLQKLLSEQNESKVLKRMVRLWANFAKTGNPTPSEDDSVLKGFKWTPIEKGSDKTNYLHITAKLKMEVNPLGKRKQFWEDFFAKYSQLAVDGVVQSPPKETTDEPPQKETNDEKPLEETNDKQTENETNDGQPQIETIDEQLQNEPNDKQPQEETNDKGLQNETDNEQPENETNNEQPQEKTTDEQPQEETNDEQPQEETTDEQPQEEMTDEQPQEESTDEQPQEETTNEQPQEESNNEQPQKATHEEL